LVCLKKIETIFIGPKGTISHIVSDVKSFLFLCRKSFCSVRSILVLRYCIKILRKIWRERGRDLGAGRQVEVWLDSG
jgi:hypothetical protein